MKKLFAALLAIVSSIAFATTTVPIQLLNPAGSTSGQVIESTGASSAPAWTTMVVANVTGAAPLTGATFTGATGLGYSNPVFSLNDTSGSNSTAIAMNSNGTSEWSIFKSSANNFGVGRYVSGSFVDNPVSISNATGIVTMTDGIVSGPASVTTLSATGNDVLLYTNTSAQSIPNATATTVTGWTKSFDRLNTNFNASTGVFTAPATGFYFISSCITFASAVWGAGQTIELVITANGTTVALGTIYPQATFTQPVTVCGSSAISLTSGQIATIQVFQNSSVARTLNAVTAQNWVSINRIP